MFRQMIALKPPIFAVLTTGIRIPGRMPNRWQSSAAPVTAPRLIYLQNPVAWLANKMRLQKLRYTWDREFREADFKRGVNQATVVLTENCRTHRLAEIQRITTAKGFAQITEDLNVSRNDPRIQMMQFRTRDIRRTIPVRVHFVAGERRRRHCFIDMFLVGLRRAVDMEMADRQRFWQQLQLYDRTLDLPKWGAEHERKLLLMPDGHGDGGGREDGSVGEPVVFAEMYVRFHKEYSIGAPNQWNIAYFKIASFDVLSL